MTTFIYHKPGPSYFQWAIDNFISFGQPNLIIESPPFYYADGNSWWLKVLKNGDVDEDYIALYLMRKKKLTCSVSVKLGILSADDSVFFSRSFQETVTKDRLKVGASDFILRSYFVESIDRITNTGTVRIFAFLQLAENELLKVDSIIETTRNFKEVAGKYQELYNSKQYADVSLIVGEVEFPAHKAILSSRSVVFSEKIANEKPDQILRIFLEDCSLETFDYFLEFLYCGKLKPISPTDVFKLHDTAVKFKVHDLIEECIYAMSLHITIETLADTVLVGVRGQIEELLHSCSQFYQKNVDRVQESQMWRALFADHGDVAMKFCAYLDKFPNE